jgi:hypothetical protein
VINLEFGEQGGLAKRREDREQIGERMQVDFGGVAVGKDDAEPLPLGWGGGHNFGKEVSVRHGLFERFDFFEFATGAGGDPCGIQFLAMLRGPSEHHFVGALRDVSGEGFEVVDGEHDFVFLIARVKMGAGMIGFREAENDLDSVEL